MQDPNNRRFPTHLGDAPKAEKAIEDAQEEFAHFQDLSDAELVGLIGLVNSNIVRETCAVEMQRRLKDVIDRFNQTSIT